MKSVQQLYPDPPLVLFVSNNEAPDLRWHQVELSGRYLDNTARGGPDEFKRKVVAEGWMERYPVMFQAMREALVSDAWRKNVRFVGYGAFGPSHFGRWPQWKEYSLITDEWTSPDWHIWDGGSPSYYTHNWCPNRDHWVWSTQVESMNWIFQLEEAWKVKPDFWWEVSTWDGNNDWTPGYRVHPVADGEIQSLPVPAGRPDVHARAVPRLGPVRPVVACGREWSANSAQHGAARTLAAVLRAGAHRRRSGAYPRHARRFLALWRARREPGSSPSLPGRIPEKYRDVPRWYLLDTHLDPHGLGK